MKITLYLKERIVDFRLPNEISGSFSFGINENENLINVESKNGEWVLYQTDDVSIVLNDAYLKEVILTENTFHVLQRNNTFYLIYVSSLISSHMLSYTYLEEKPFSIGKNNQSHICYNCDYFKNLSLTLIDKAGRFVVEKQDNNPVYINKKAVFDNPFIIHYGDELEFYGFRMFFLKGLLLLQENPNRLIINSNLGNLQNFECPLLELPKDMEIKDIDLYKKEDYFSKAPRLRRIIETKEITLSAPPKEGDGGELPLILVIGPMLTMGVMAATMLVSTLIRINNKETTWGESWPQLITSGAMLLSMILWPLVTQAYNRHMKKKKKKEIFEKYTAYLAEKKHEFQQESILQKGILFENLITTNDCLNIIKSKSENRYKGINFWDKRIDQSDFLVTRIGIGNEKLDVKVQYPEEEFTIEEDDLKKQADALVEEYKYIPDVPIGYSFYQNKITAIIGQDNKVLPFMHNNLLQLMTFYSYEDLKFVLFTNENRKEYWEYLKYLKHSFNNSCSFRFVATNPESTKLLAEYISFEINNRLSQLSNDKKILYKPHYFIIVDDYSEVKHYDFIKDLTEIEENLGFSLVIMESRLSNLPSRCNNFITLSNATSGVLKNSYEKQEQINFIDEINYHIDMMPIVKVLSNIPIEFEEGMNQLPDAITFLEMEKLGKVEQLNILNRWNTSDATTSLKAEVGIDDQGYLMFLDLHEKAHGPHGLIAGMTGSGKSEFIITYILSMAINYSPDDVAFILIDYKGGGLAFAFENKTTGVRLPHLAGTITNLDKAELNRTLVSINSEVKRRQEIFNEARDQLGESTIDIYKYQRFYKEGKLKQAIPHLFIVCDEFAELKSQQPEFMDNLISVARIGRSLGVHLILATQKPSGVVNDQIWSNTRFRVCLKVQDESDSREMLKRPEAASLKQTGRFYLQVGYDEYFALGQSGWCGAKYYPSDKILKQVDKSINFIDDCGNFIKSIQASGKIKLEAKGEQLQAIMNEIIKVSKLANKETKLLWLENIPEVILLHNLEQKYQITHTPYQVSATIGEYDAPEKQEQGIVSYSYLKDGNTIIYGNDGSERDTLLDTIIYSSTLHHTSDEINYYIIDYGSESLRRFTKLPHVGGIVFSSEEEKYNNLLKLIKEELQNRKKLFVDYGGEYQNYIISSGKKLPLKVIILNNYDSIYENRPEAYEELPDLIRDSERYGIIFIITANAINSVQNKLSQSCPNIYAFKVKDPSDYMSIFGTRIKIVPRDIEGRGLFRKEEVHEFQVASIVSLENDLNEYINQFIQKQRQLNQGKAKRIPVLPETIRYTDVQEEVTTIQNVPIGISKNELDIYTIDYLMNIGNIISSNKLINTENFVKSLLGILIQIEKNKVMIIDSTNTLLPTNSSYQNYYTQDFEKVLDDVIIQLEELIQKQSKEHHIILIYGFSKFISKIEDISKMTKLSTLLKEYENMILIAVDDAAKLKSYAFESWYNSLFNLSDGIWIGRGIADQSLFHLSTVNKEMTFDYKNDMGYVVSEGMGTLCKFIDFVSTEGDNDDK